MAQAAAVAAPFAAGTPDVSRVYNFASDIISSNLKAGRAAKPAFIDQSDTWSYGQLADRVNRFGAMLRVKDLRREERVLICLLDTIDWPTAFLGALRQDHVKGQPAPLKYPRWIEFRQDLPKTATGRIQRFKLRAEAP